MSAALSMEPYKPGSVLSPILGARQTVLNRAMVIMCMQVKKPSLRETKSLIQRCCQPTQFNPKVTDAASV